MVRCFTRCTDQVIFAPYEDQLVFTVTAHWYHTMYQCVVRYFTRCTDQVISDDAAP